MSNWWDPASWDWVNQSLGTGTYDPGNQTRQQLGAVGGSAQGFGNQLASAAGQDRSGMAATQGYLTDQMQGKNSVSAEQLRQGLGQQLAQQQAMAASANPQNAAMASRNAAMNMGQASYGMAGQQALAGLQERNQAASLLGQLQGQQYGTDVGGATGAYGAATNAYGLPLQYPQMSPGKMFAGGISGLLGGMAASDKRLKKDIEAEDDDGKKSKEILSNLKPYSYTYKDEKFGKGDQYGVMAQDMEKAGLGHAVMDTPYGKMVHGTKAATSALALTASLAKRLDELEKEREGKGKRSTLSDEEDDE